MSDSRNDALLAKVMKLLALADNSRGATEAEAALAATKVQEYLHILGMSLAEVESAGGKGDDGGREKRVVQRSSMYRWQRDLMGAIAETNFCLHRISEHRATEWGRAHRVHQLVGRKVNVEASMMVYDYLVTTMKRLVSEAGYAPGRHNEKDYHIWLEACSDRLGQRLRQRAYEARVEDERKKEEQAKQSGGGRALVLADVYGNEVDLNNDMLNGYAPGTTAARRQEYQERERQHAARVKELVAGGMDEIEAMYVSWGYGAERAKEAAAEYYRSLKSPSRSRTHRTRAWTKSDEREHQKRNSRAWRQGSQAGSEIGLDRQVGKSDRRGIK